MNAIQDEKARALITRLLNMIEQLAAENRELKAEIQRLRDEINRMKGEQGKPDIKANKGKTEEASNQSSEKERHEPRARHKGSKKAEIEIDREEVVKVNREELPGDAEFKGYEEVVVQDIVVKSDNVRFRKEKYYAASTQKSYEGEMPCGYEGQFGPGVKSHGIMFLGPVMIFTQDHEAQMMV